MIHILIVYARVRRGGGQTSFNSSTGDDLGEIHKEFDCKFAQLSIDHSPSFCAASLSH